MLAAEDKYFEDLMRQLLQRFRGTAGARLLQVCLKDSILVSLFQNGMISTAIEPYLLLLLGKFCSKSQ